MVQLLTWEWLARDILFQLANDRSIGLPWRRSGRVMVYIGCPRTPPGCKKESGLREELCKNQMVVYSRKRAMEKLLGIEGV